MKTHACWYFFRLVLVAIVGLVPVVSRAQGRVDTVFDQSGNKYPLSKLQVPIPPPSMSSMSAAMVASTCNTGYFQLYFDAGSGMDGTSAVELQRQAAMCQLFADLSNFISSPLSTTGEKVNILITDLGQFQGAPSNAIGVATSFYTWPFFSLFSSTPASKKAILDNTMWKTIISGRDAFENEVTPINAATAAGSPTNPPHFHAMMAFNFNTYNFNSDLSVAPAGNEYDLYSVALHEVTHALGFASLIEGNGRSVLYTGVAQYYSRYDLRLQTASGQPLITVDPTCNLYDPAFFISPSSAGPLLSPNSSACNPTDQTTCSTAIKYVGSVTQPVFTPNCFIPGSSLSHFEDECAGSTYTPSTPSNNQYFVMCNQYGQGSTYMRRYLKPEERSVLCDLGYTLGSSYGTLANSTYINYGSGCSGITVAGVADGINNGAYKYVVGAERSIRITDILSNDRNANKIECLEVVLGNGTISHLSNSEFTYTPNVVGFPDDVHVLRYIPVNTSTGQRGNITFVQISVKASDCESTPCRATGEMVKNGGFESATGCGVMQHSSYNPWAQVDCWKDYVFSPYLFTTSCSDPLYAITASDTWNNGGTSSNPNTKFVKLQNYLNNYQSIQAPLSYPMIAGGAYTLTFQAKLASGSTSGVLQVSGAPTIMVPTFYTFVNVVGFPAAVHTLGTVNIGSSTWSSYTLNFTYSATSTPTQLATLILSRMSGDIFIDDVSLVPVSVPAAPTSATGLLSHYGITGNTITTDDVIAIDGTFVVNSDINFVNCPNILASPNALISVQPGKTVKFLNGTVIKATCGSTWQGVTATGSTCGIYADLAEFHDMTSGISSFNGAFVSSKRSKYVNGARGLVFWDAPAGYGAIIEENEFYTAKASLKWPYEFPNGQSGIRIHNCKQLKIGNYTTGTGNKFHDLSIGIYVTAKRNFIFASNSQNIEVYNSEFKNIVGGYYSNTAPFSRSTVPVQSAVFNDLPGSAIVAHSNTFLVTPSTMCKLTVKNTSGSSTTFSGCDKNILLTGFSADIQNLAITDGYGVMINRATMNTYSISGNTMMNMVEGVHLIGDANAATISNNQIEMLAIPPSSRFSSLHVAPGNTGINLQGMLNTATGSVQVSDNTVTFKGKSGNGILLLNPGSGTALERNQITLATATAPAGFDWLTGIGMTDGLGVVMAGNHIDGNSLTMARRGRYAVQGINVNTSFNSNLTCNYNKQTTYGFLVSGDCTTPPTNVVTNSFHDHVYGMLFSTQGSEGTFGNIGTSTFDNKNAFTGSYAGLANVYKLSNCAVSVRDKIYTTLPCTSGGNNPLCNHQPLSNPGATAAPSCLTIGYPIGNPGGNTVPDIAYAETIVRGLVVYQYHPNENTWLAQMRLLNILRDDDAARIASVVLDSFYTSVSAGEMGGISEVNKWLANMHNATDSASVAFAWSEAVTANLSIPVATAQGANEQLINGIYLKYVIGGIDTLTATDSLDIASLATACPVMVGTAVYKARSLNALYYPSWTYNDLDLCSDGRSAEQDGYVTDNEGEGGDGGRQANMRYARPSKHTTSLSIYPNPASRLLNVEYAEPGILDITDVTGRKVLTVSLTNLNGGREEINTVNLVSGVYLCRYVVGGVIKETRKVVIAND